jgi:predicted phage baseplate assembly protein
VTNYHPADGGHDAETMDQVKVRGPWELKHRNRAVTAEDFERLARKASGLVALANCYEDQGEVHVVIVPKDFGEKPQPGRWLVRQVTKYLDERRLINTRLKVLGPIYELIDVEVDLVLDPLFVRQFEETSLKARKCLQDFVHPISGLNDGTGWPLGRTLHLSELYYLLEGEKFEGVDHVDAMRMARTGTRKWEENISIGDRSYPSFARIEIRQVFNS